jgi:leader peptidase (prepilin peptidase)/N-methyltransferase
LIGFTYSLLPYYVIDRLPLLGIRRTNIAGLAYRSLIAILVAAGLVLLIRWLYWLLRRREGIGLGDAKLMALLAAWLGLPGALLAFALGVILGAFAALVLLAIPNAKTQSESWSSTKLPLGTFLCVGGIISSLWGQPIIAAYLHWSGF